MRMPEKLADIDDPKSFYLTLLETKVLELKRTIQGLMLLSAVLELVIIYLLLK